MSMFNSVAAAVALAACSGLAAEGAIITSYDLTGDTGSQTTEAAASAAPNVTGAAMARGAGLAASAAGGSFSATGFGGTAASPAEDTDYISFGFDVASGFEVDLSTLTIATRSSGTGPGAVGLYYSADNYAAPITTFTQGNGTFTNSIVDLSALPVLTGSVQFRLIEVGDLQADGVGATAATGTFRVAEYLSTEVGATSQDVTFEGTVAAAVPEPASLALVGLGVLALARRRRSR